MQAERESRATDPDAELRWESVRMARAKRQLVEHELTRRRTLLALTVALTVVGTVTALVGDLSVGGAFAGSALVPGVAAAWRRSSEP